MPLRRKTSNINSKDGSKNKKSSQPFSSALFPILMLAAMTFYVLGFIQSIRSLPEIDGNNNINPPMVMNVERKTNTASTDLEADTTAVTASDASPPNSPPVAKWPVSIRDEEGMFEDIIHPGDHETHMNVPKFWSDPLVAPDADLMTAELAKKVGSYDTSNGKVAGSPESRTIFIAIASYRDFQCRETVESIFKTAKYPERVRVGIVDQIDEDDLPCDTPIYPCEEDPSQALCKFRKQVDNYEMEAKLAIGPVFARHVGHRLYRGEYYTMQIDAHVTFVIDWDVDAILQMDATKNDMAVISTYLTDIIGSIDEKTGKSLRNTRPIMCNTAYEGGGQGKHLRHLSQPEAVPPIKDMPQLQPYWAAGYSFSRGHFLVNVPYDLYLPMIFQGEETSIGIRGFTYGYDFYAPQRSVCFHTYAEGENARKRAKVHHFWDNGRLYQGDSVGAMTRLLGIIGMLPEIHPSKWNHAEEKRYGTGSVRSLSKFFETFGIDVVNKKVEQRLCSFVQRGTMHRDFMKYLRPDGMGIDYDQIDYKFKTPKTMLASSAFLS